MESNGVSSQCTRATTQRTERALASLIAGLGTEGFVHDFAQYCIRLSRADQLTMFALEGGRVHPVFAYRPGEDEIARAQSRLYLQSFAAQDQILARRLRYRNTQCASIVVHSREIVDTAYRTRLFTDVGLAGKIALLGANAGGHFYLNFYYRNLGSVSYLSGAVNLGQSAQLLLELARKHDLMGGGLLPRESIRKRLARRLRERMPSLSHREVEVCASILCGKSLAEISREMGVSHSTVRTFCKRAYNKLEIRSQGGLFACCAGLLIS